MIPSRSVSSSVAALTIQLPPSAAFAEETSHCIYIKHHEPNVPDPDSERSLFLGNIPITTTEAHLKHFFNVQLATGRVDRVNFPTFARASRSSDLARSRSTRQKRKRFTIDDIEAELQSSSLPTTWERTLHPIGAHAIVVFVDQPSMDAAFSAVYQAARNGTQILWSKNIEEGTPPVGLNRYRDHIKRRYPPRSDLLRSVNTFMKSYTQLEELRSQEAARKRQGPDKEGFITITKGSRGGVVGREDATALAEKQKQKHKNAHHENFYRFQNRARRKEQQAGLIRRFEEDKQKVEDMRKRRGNLVVGTNIFPVVTLLMRSQPD